jgi:hypothetical protein
VSIPLDTGDRVAWTEQARGIIVAMNLSETRMQRRFTVALWGSNGFSGHLTRIPGALLHRTACLSPGPPSTRATADGRS